jgi:phosphoribosylaminoimidazolecarboxamide formyltransferase/IMP cyclohydrolase
MKVKRALISVFDKTGIEEFGSGLAELGVEIVATGGTFKRLQEAGVKSRPVQSLTAFPEILDGRVKTLNPKIFGGILARRENKTHIDELKRESVGLIDMVVVNLYPFEETVNKREVSLEEALENIDIGGPSLLRASAKNFDDVAVICNPARYKEVLRQLKENDCQLSKGFLLDLAQEAFAHTSRYEAAIASYFERLKVDETFPRFLSINLEKAQPLRYGENPHQEAALYRFPRWEGTSLATAELLSGKELSYNNLADLQAALDMTLDFKKPFAVIIKHSTPCGAACGESVAEAYKEALACDPMSAYGGIIGLNQSVDLETAREVHDTFFVECILAPDYEPEALELLRKKKNRRIIKTGPLVKATDQFSFKLISGGALLQTPDDTSEEPKLKVVTEAKPTEEQIKSLLFAWRVVAHVRSNAVVLAQGEKIVGIGGGQTSRVDSVIIALRKAERRAKNSVCASDAFFPMPDSIEKLGEAGVRAVIQPGGSKGDEKVIEACNKCGMAMVFTGVRHFRH